MHLQVHYETKATLSNLEKKKVSIMKHYTSLEKLLTTDQKQTIRSKKMSKIE